MVGVPSKGPRKHTGDIMSSEKRSALMSRIRGKDTKPEITMAEALTLRGLAYERHAADLPGRPDFVFRSAKVAVFVDGDFWHGWRFPQWRSKLATRWQVKIEGNRKRDIRCRRRLRRMGWTVVRIWEHQVRADPDACVARITSLENLVHRRRRKPGAGRQSLVGSVP